MNTLNLTAATDRPVPRLKPLLLVDALTCVLMGALLVLAAAPMATLLGLPQDLLFYAGLVLFPCAALMAQAARSLHRLLVWMVILGNFAWVVASGAIVFVLEPTTLGVAFTLIQAAAVALLGILEWRAWRAEREVAR
jgi:hypothetical protein